MGEARRRREAGLPPKGKPAPTPRGTRAWLGHVFNVPGLGKVERQVDGTYYLIGPGRRRASIEDIAKIEEHHRREQRIRREQDAAMTAALARAAAAQHTERADLPEPEPDDAA